MTNWLAILLALAPMYLIRLSFADVPTTFFELLIYFSVIVAVGTNAIRWRQLSERIGAIGWLGLGLVFVGTIIGVVVSSDLRTALGEAKGFVIDPILIALLVLGTIDRDDIPKLMRGYLVSATLVSLVSLVAQWLDLGWAVAGDGRLLGIYGLEMDASPNYLAFWIAPAVAIGIAWLSTPPWRRPEGTLPGGHPKRWQYLMALATVVNVLALTGSASRAALAGAIVAGVLGIAAYYRSTLLELPYAQAIGWVLTIALIGFGAAVVQPDFAQDVSDGGRISSSNNIRWEIWHTTGALLTESPGPFLLGLGVGNYQHDFGSQTVHRVNYPEFITPLALTPHNLWLNAWVNLGLLGFVGITLLTLIALRTLWFHPTSIEGSLVTALVLTILLQGLVDTPNWKNDTAALFWLGLACTALLLHSPHLGAKQPR